MSPEPATCGVPGCGQRAVFARSTEERTVVLCRRHRDRLLEGEVTVEDDAERGPEPESLGTRPALAVAAGGARW